MKGKRSIPKLLLGIAVGVFAALLLVLSLPLFAAVAVVLRVILLAIAIAALLGSVVVYLLSPRFRSWLTAQLDEQPKYKGLRLRNGVSLADGHSWVRPKRRGSVIGVDDLAQRALGPIDSVELPETGAMVWRGEPFITLHHGSRRLELRSPLSGTVLRRNTDLLEQPSQVNGDPYGRGWAVEIMELQPPSSRRLHEGERARIWFHDEIDQLIETIEPTTRSVQTMADGGTFVEDLYRVLDDATWRRVHRRFFESRESGELS
jgi:glycine cleavage system H protein